MMTQKLWHTYYIQKAWFPIICTWKFAALIATMIGKFRMAIWTTTTFSTEAANKQWEEQNEKCDCQNTNLQFHW